MLLTYLNARNYNDSNLKLHYCAPFNTQHFQGARTGVSCVLRNQSLGYFLYNLMRFERDFSPRCRSDVKPRRTSELQTVTQTFRGCQVGVRHWWAGFREVWIDWVRLNSGLQQRGAYAWTPASNTYWHSREKSKSILTHATCRKHQLQRMRKST